MAKTNKNNGSPAPVKKLTGKELLQKYWIFLLIILILFVIGAWAGFVLDDVGFKKLIKHPEKYISQYLAAEYFVMAALQALKFEGTAFMGSFIGGTIGFFIFAMFAKTAKRFHRKGVEHGSARWGSQEEKDIIADTNDFFNNVIVASDVFLVLDRKERDWNALTDKEKANRKRIQEEKEAKAKGRITALENELISFKSEFPTESEVSE